MLSRRYPYFPDEPLGKFELTYAYGDRFFPRLATIAAEPSVRRPGGGSRAILVNSVPCTRAQVAADHRAGALKCVLDALTDQKRAAEVVRTTDLMRTCARGLTQWEGHAKCELRCGRRSRPRASRRRAAGAASTPA